jgi:hypothetical protein
LREESQVELWVETPNGLSAGAILPKIPTLRQQKNVGPRPTLRRVRINADSISKNAISFSSARTTKRFPSRCAEVLLHCIHGDSNNNVYANTNTGGESDH